MTSMSNWELFARRLANEPGLLPGLKFLSNRTNLIKLDHARGQVLVQPAKLPESEVGKFNNPYPDPILGPPPFGYTDSLTEANALEVGIIPKSGPGFSGLYVREMINLTVDQVISWLAQCVDHYFDGNWPYPKTAESGGEQDELVKETTSQTESQPSKWKLFTRRLTSESGLIPELKATSSDGIIRLRCAHGRLILYPHLLTKKMLKEYDERAHVLSTDTDSLPPFHDGPYPNCMSINVVGGRHQQGYRGYYMQTFASSSIEQMIEKLKQVVSDSGISSHSVESESSSAHSMEAASAEAESEKRVEETSPQTNTEPDKWPVFAQRLSCDPSPIPGVTLVSSSNFEICLSYEDKSIRIEPKQLPGEHISQYDQYCPVPVLDDRFSNNGQPNGISILITSEQGCSLYMQAITSLSVAQMIEKVARCLVGNRPDFQTELVRRQRHQQLIDYLQSDSDTYSFALPTGQLKGRYGMIGNFRSAGWDKQYYHCRNYRQPEMTLRLYFDTKRESYAAELDYADGPTLIIERGHQTPKQLVDALDRQKLAANFANRSEFGQRIVRQIINIAGMGICGLELLSIEYGQGKITWRARGMTLVISDLLVSKETYPRLKVKVTLTRTHIGDDQADSEPAIDSFLGLKTETTVTDHTLDDYRRIFHFLETTYAPVVRTSPLVKSSQSVPLVQDSLETKTIVKTTSQTTSEASEPEDDLDLESIKGTSFYIIRDTTFVVVNMGGSLAVIGKLEEIKGQKYVHPIKRAANLQRLEDRGLKIKQELAEQGCRVPLCWYDSRGEFNHALQMSGHGFPAGTKQYYPQWNSGKSQRYLMNVSHNPFARKANTIRVTDRFHLIYDNESYYPQGIVLWREDEGPSAVVGCYSGSLNDFTGKSIEPLTDERRYACLTSGMIIAC